MLFFGLLMISSTVGCNGEKSEEQNRVEALPFEGITVRLALPRELELSVQWEIPLDEWSARTGARYELIEYEQPVDADSDQLPTGDLVVFSLGRLSAWRDRDRLARMPETMKDQLALNWQDLLPGIRDSLTTSREVPIAVPISMPALVCYYRQDLLDRAGLEPPRTWDDYEKLVKTLDRWGDGLTVVEPWHPHWRATTFLARAAASVKHPGNLGSQFDINTGEPLIDTPGYVSTLEAIVQGMADRSPDSSRMTPIDCRRAMLEGKAALAIGMEIQPGAPVWPWGPQLPENDNGDGQASDSGNVTTSAPSLVDRAREVQIGISPLPGAERIYNLGVKDWESIANGEVNRVSLIGFCGIAAGVSSEADERVREACWNLLIQIGVEQIEQYFSLAHRSICREGDLLNVATWGGPELSGEEQREFSQSMRTSLTDHQTVAELPITHRREFRAALTEGITAALEQKLPPAEALAEVARRWSEIVERVGADTVRDSYRKSLGLSPISGAALPAP